MTTISANPIPRTDAEVYCAHCSLPVPAGMVVPHDDRQFCCGGCRTVHDAIHACGLAAFYRLVDDGDSTLAPARPTDRTYDDFDDAAFRDLHCRRTAGGLTCTELYVEGVHCAACVWLIERLPGLVPGVAEARLDFRRHVVRVVWDDEQTSLSAVARRLDALGYPAHPYRASQLHERRRQEDRRALVRIGVAGALAGNVMLLAFALYGGVLHGIEPIYETLFKWVSLALTALALLWPGRVFFTGAVGAMRAGAVHMDVPVAVGLAAGGLWSAFNTVRGTGDVYFDSMTVLVFLLLVGRWIQQRQQRSSHDAVELLFSLTPGTARRIDDDIVREVPVESLRVDEIVEVRPGDTVPVDGVIVEGRSDVDLATLTGESGAQPVDVGDRVHAGTTNLGRPVRVQVKATGEATRVGRLMHMVEEHARRRAPVVRLADQVAGVFVIVVLALAAATALLWCWLDPSRAVPNALALLIVTCPCALGLATPLAIVAAIGKAARVGIFVKGGEVIERLGRPGLVLLDKTGTLTAGRTEVVEWHGPESLKVPAARLESVSSHPIARAFIEAFDGVGGATDVHETMGHGIEGFVDGRRLVIGSRRFLESRDVVIRARFLRAERRLVARGLSPVFISADGVAEAIAAVGDPIERDAFAAIVALRKSGWKVGVLSGDHPDVVRSVAVQVGIPADDARGGATPEEKLSIVREAAASGPVVMVGDGVNDAAALAAATVGVAVHGGAEASLSAADVYLRADGLTPLVETLDGARRTLSVIRRNLIVSLMYNAVGVGLAVSGVLNPLIAAVLMPLSSLTVITMSYRARTFGRQQEATKR